MQKKKKKQLLLTMSEPVIIVFEFSEKYIVMQINLELDAYN